MLRNISFDLINKYSHIYIQSFENIDFQYLYFAYENRGIQRLCTPLWGHSTQIIKGLIWSHRPNDPESSQSSVKLSDEATENDLHPRRHLFIMTIIKLEKRSKVGRAASRGRLPAPPCCTGRRVSNNGLPDAVVGPVPESLSTTASEQRKERADEAFQSKKTTIINKYIQVPFPQKYLTLLKQIKWYSRPFQLCRRGSNNIGLYGAHHYNALDRQWPTWTAESFSARWLPAETIV